MQRRKLFQAATCTLSALSSRASTGICAGFAHPALTSLQGTPLGKRQWDWGRQASTSSQPSFAATQALLEAAQAHHFQSRLEELRQQHACLPFPDLVSECHQSMPAGTEEDARRVCQALHSAGLILRHGDVALLRPDDINEIVTQVLPVDSQRVQARLEAAQQELAPLEEQFALLQHRVRRRQALFKLGGLTLLMGHFAAFVRLTYWELSWDVMEPIAFLVSTFGGMLMYAYFMRTHGNFSWSDAQKRMVSKWEARAFEKADFDFPRYCQLRREVQRYSGMLQAQAQLQQRLAQLAEQEQQAEQEGQEQKAKEA